MESLLGRLRRIKNEVASVLSESCLDSGETKAIKEALELYSRFTKDAARVSVLINEGAVTQEDRAGVRKLEEQVDTAWLKLSEEARKKLVDMLLIKKTLPEEIVVALRIFDAKVVSLV